MLRIPFDPKKSADQSLRVLIPELQVMSLRLVWNIRAEGWNVMVADTEGASLGYLRLVPNFPLLYEHKGLSPIVGDLIALPLTEGTGRPLTDYDALGESWGLFWLSPEDVKAWERANGLG
jgi:hypothetical protein